VIEGALVRSPLNTAVTRGTSVTLKCGSDVSDSYVEWYSNRLCENYYVVKRCTSSILIYSGYSHIPNPLKFNITKASNATHVTRDLIIKSTQLTDAGIYLCEEHIAGEPGVQASSSAQVIVLGNYR